MEHGSDGQQTLSQTSMELACHESWSWDRRIKSHEVRFYDEGRKTAHFHPNWSNGTAGVMAERAINTHPPTRFYWEIHITDRLFGTSMMFGVATRNCNVHADSFVNLIGSDCNGWGLSHKGILWHDSLWSKYTKPFKENTATNIGMLYDGHHGTLTYFKDGVNLGVAFKDLNKIPEKLYPMVCSTAAKTQMTLVKTCRDYYNLKDRCRGVILNNLQKPNDVNHLDLPRFMKEFIQHTGSEEEDFDSDEDCNCSNSTIFPILNPNFNAIQSPAPAQHFKDSSFHFSQL